MPSPKCSLLSTPLQGRNQLEVKKKPPAPRKELKKLKPYQPGKPIEEVKRELKLRRIVKLASNENALGPSPRALRAIHRALPSIATYPEGSCPALREAVAAHFGVKAPELVFGSGSDEVLHLIGLAYLRQGDQTITCSPSFAIYETTSRLFGAAFHPLPLRNFCFDLDAMANAITSRTRVLFIANPNNPTGTIVTKREFEHFLQRVPERVLVVLDEAYAEYVDAPNYPQGIDYIHRVPLVVLRTFSKIYGLAGLRIGFGIAHKEIAQQLDRVREPFNVNRLAQEAALAALLDRAHLKASRDLVAKERKRLTQELQALGCFVVPSQANFLYVDTGRPSQSIFQKLLQRGIIVRSGFPSHPTFIRATIGLSEENDLLLHWLKRALKKEV